MPRPSTAAFEAEVIDVEDLSPTFRRITFGGEGLRDFGIAHHPRDQRFKLVIPPGGADPTFDLVGFLAEHESRGVSWYQAWLQLDPALRGAMRTYTIREWRDASRELVVDMVLHTDDEGHSGPAARWALDAAPGSRLHIVGPSRHGQASTGGIEFHPGSARHILLVGDETAVPAIASILDHLRDAEVTGQAILEVPTADDVQELTGPAGVDVVWLPREGAPIGSLIEPAVRRTVTVTAPASPGADPALDDVDVDREILWDVPEALTRAARESGTGVEEQERPFYAWIAGEAAVVKSLRRHLVRDIGVDRRQVAFMGYWRDGRAEGQ